MQKPVDISIVIPLLNEEQSLSPLNDWIFKVFNNQTLSFELIYIDDGSTDESWKSIVDLSKKYSNIKGICFAKNFGKSQALHAGFESANGKYVVTLDADLQ
ncbi:MAG: glycosyltransferase, partial [Flavobacteriaceae bacterium]|nr:glycosyltransferase [Flavobacteriaceae bacterium]